MSLTLLCICFIIYILVSVKFIKHTQPKSASELFSANKSLGIWGVSMSLIATQIGGGTIIGTAEEAYKNGISGIFYTMGISIGFLILGFIGAQKLRSMEITTISEIFEKYYDSRFLRKLSSLLSILALLGITIGQVAASKKIFSLTGLEPYFSTIFWLIIIFHISLNGMKAISSMSKIQSVIMYSIFGSILFLILKKANLNEIYLNQKINNLNKVNFSNLLVPFLFCLIEQDVAQSFFSAKSQKAAKYGAIMGGVLLIIFGLIPLTIGLAAQKYEIITGSVLSEFILINTPKYFSILCDFGILMAIVSTANSLICAISSSITLDFFSNNIKIGKITTIVIGILSIILGNYSNNLLDTFIESYRILVCSVFFSVFITYFKNTKLSKNGALLSIIGGVFTYILLKFYNVNYLELYCLIVQIIFYYFERIINSLSKKLKLNLN